MNADEPTETAIECPPCRSLRICQAHKLHESTYHRARRANSTNRTSCICEVRPMQVVWLGISCLGSALHSWHRAASRVPSSRKWLARDDTYTYERNDRVESDRIDHAVLSTVLTNHPNPKLTWQGKTKAWRNSLRSMQPSEPKKKRRSCHGNSLWQVARVEY